VKYIIISVKGNDIRAAVYENGNLVEILDDMKRESRLAGGIYRGRVENIVPGMQAAFVDIGLDKNAFLYAGDVVMPEILGNKNVSTSEVPPIKRLLAEGQMVTVQVMREPVGSKGPRVSMELSIPGRFTVFLPKVNYLGVSRKILDDDERERLRKIAEDYRSEGTGLIVRTLAQGVSEIELREDVEKLLKKWEGINFRIGHMSNPGLIYTDSDSFSRLLRETIDNDVDKIIVDNKEFGEELKISLDKLHFKVSPRVIIELKKNIFEEYEVEQEILKALKEKVWMKSGSYLVIEHTEALTVIDVNTGKYTGKLELEETLLKTNKEAALEIARQIRLQNLSGIIVVDFIDMEEDKDWNAVLETLEEACIKDKGKIRIIGRTGLGLVELTRKKEGQPLYTRYTVKCSTCGGRGRVFRNDSD